MLLLRQCQSVTPVNRFEFDPPIPQLDMQGSVDGDAANEFSPPVAGKSPPHSFDCPTIEDALVALTSAGRLFEAQRRVEREIDRWETEVDFWAAAFGGKEALYVLGDGGSCRPRWRAAQHTKLDVWTARDGARTGTNAQPSH